MATSTRSYQVHHVRPSFRELRSNLLLNCINWTARSSLISVGRPNEHCVSKRLVTSPLAEHRITANSNQMWKMLDNRSWQIAEQYSQACKKAWQLLFVALDEPVHWADPGETSLARVARLMLREVVGRKISRVVACRSCRQRILRAVSTRSFADSGAERYNSPAQTALYPGD